MDGFLRLNVAGHSYRILINKVDRYPTSRLGRLAAQEKPSDGHLIGLCDAYLEDSNEFYFDRPVKLFESVFAFYQTGKIHRPLLDCPRALDDEIAFWGAPATAKCTDCDTPKGFTSAEPLHDLEDTEPSAYSWHGVVNELEAAEAREQSEEEEESLRNRKCGQPCYEAVRKRVWRLTEEPGSSKAALAFCVLSVMFIVGTVLVIIMESLPNFQQTECLTYAKNSTSNETTSICEQTVQRPIKDLTVADSVFMFWFTLEYVARLWSAPNSWQYFKHPLSLIDLFALLPFYLEMLSSAVGGVSGATAYSVQKTMQSGRTLRILRVFRSLRILKLARYSSDIRLLGQALKQSRSEFIMILVYVMFATFMYSTILYHVEMDDSSDKYGTIPNAAWWTIATTFTYGDAPPKSIPGKIISSTGFVAGILLLAFPISVLVEKFSSIYDVKREKAKSKLVDGITSKISRNGSLIKDIRVRQPTDRSVSAEPGGGRVGEHTGRKKKKDDVRIAVLQQSPSVIPEDDVSLRRDASESLLR